MNRLHRYRFSLVFAVVLCLVLLGRWAMLPKDVVNEPASIATDAAIDNPRTKASPQEIAEPAPAVVPAASDIASSVGILRGRVIDAATREPVREFELQFHGNQAPGARTFRTNDGRFEWPDVPASTWTVTARARGYQRFQLSELQISSGQVTPEIVMPLRRGHALRGRVYDESSRIGVASARIAFREAHVGAFDGNWRMRVHVNSQKDGSFVLDGVPAGRVTLSVHAQEYASRELDVVVGEETAPLEIGISAGGTISGYLAASDGLTPVAGMVALSHLDQGVGSARRTGDAGEFSFRHLVAGRYQLTGQSGGRSVEREIVLADNERLEGLVLALRGGRSIRGVVTGVAPKDFERVSISVRRGRNGGSSFASVGVDTRGEYVLQGVEPGRVQVVADVQVDRQISKIVEVPTDADITVNLDFPRGARLSGRVTRAGKPLARVWLEPASERLEPLPVAGQSLFIYGTSTSEAGDYALENLPAGEYYIRVGSYRSKTVRLSGDTVFDIDVPAAQLSGRLAEEGGKVPIVDADVNVWSLQPNSSPVRLHGRSDDFGQFALAGLEPGDFMFSVYKPGYEMHRERISYGSPMAGMTIRLRPAKGVAIRAQEAGSGKPLRNVFATEMIGDSHVNSLQLHLDEEGVGYIPSALAGSTLSFSAYGYAPTLVRNWSGQGLDLQLQRQKAR